MLSRDQVKSFLLLFCLGFVFLHSQSVRAWETDQYNLPPFELEDIGPEISKEYEEAIREAVEGANEILSELKAQERSKARAADPYRVAKKAFRNIVGPSLFAGAGYSLYLDVEYMNDEKRSYKPRRNIYENFGASNGVGAVLVGPTVSPTVKLFSVELGVDKLGHFLSLGFRMYKNYLRYREDGLSVREAEEKAARRVNISEDLVFGLIATGVMANADRAANYAGMKFYRNLFETVKIGDKVWPPLLKKDKAGLWQFVASKTEAELYLKRFMSEHLNEALNASVYGSSLQTWAIRRAVKQSCADWYQRFPNRSYFEMRAIEKELESWYGEDYGFHGKSSAMARLSEVCYAD